MSNFFQKIGEGFEWIGKELAKAVTWVPKIVTIVDDVENDAGTILPEIGQVIDDAGIVVTTAVKDGGSDVASAEALITAIVAAAAQEGINIAADTAVAAAFETFIKTVTTSSNFADLITAVKNLTLAYDKLGGSIKTALTQLETAATAE